MARFSFKKKYIVIWNEIDDFDKPDFEEIEAYNELFATIEIKNSDYYKKLSKKLRELHDGLEEKTWKFHLVEHD